MKTRNYWLAVPILALLAVTLLVSCRNEDPVNPAQAEPTEELDRNLTLSPAAFRQAMESREQSDGITFTIEEVKRVGDELRIHVRGGCSEESFKVIWDGNVLKSFPMQVYLVLTHAQSGDNCQDAEDFFISIDLKRIVGPEADLSHYIFHVANGSIVQDAVTGPDETISSE
jgi:hypothetical protein